jgi:hypothetical protein
MNTPEPHLYAVAITATTAEPDAITHTYVRCLQASSAWGALAGAQAWIATRYPDRTGWYYQYAVCAAVDGAGGDGTVSSDG